MINCDCSVEIDSSPELFECKIVTSRKKHICVECNSEINIGEKYEYAKGLWEGSFDSFKTCLPCSNIRRDFCRSGAEFGNLRCHLLDCLNFDYISEGET